MTIHRVGSLNLFRIYWDRRVRDSLSSQTPHHNYYEIYGTYQINSACILFVIFSASKSLCAQKCPFLPLKYLYSWMSSWNLRVFCILNDPNVKVIQCLNQNEWIPSWLPVDPTINFDDFWSVRKPNDVGGYWRVSIWFEVS